MSDLATTGTKSGLIKVGILAFAGVAAATARLDFPAGKDQHSGWGAYLGGLGIGAALTVIAFFFAARAVASGSTATTALILGVLSVLALPVFWSGATMTFGAAAAYLGWTGRAGSAKSIIGFVLGLVGIGILIAATIGGW
jgi:hypothetical protein